MTSVGVISSAVVRVKRLKDLDHPEAADVFLEHLEQIKGLLVTAYDRKREAYDQRREAEAEVEIKKVVRLSYEIVDAFADPKGKGVTEKLIKSLQQNLTDVQNELTKKIQPERSATSEITASPESSTDSPRSGNAAAGPENKPKRTHFGIQGFKDGRNSLSSLFKGKGSDKEAAAAGMEQKLEGTSETDKAAAAGLVEHKPEGTSETDKAPAAAANVQEREDKSSLLDKLKKDIVTKPEDNNQEVYIVGDSGMGKSTLARKLYDDPEIRRSFDIFGWVAIDHNFQIKRVLELLLQQLDPQQPEVRDMKEMDLMVQIFHAVLNKSYLLVLDGIGNMTDWESISLALPLANSTRVIITTSSSDFKDRPHHYEISGLTRLETLALLNKEADIFGPEIGNAIYEISGGFPLYTTILGKSLESDAKKGDPYHDLIGELVTYKPKSGTPQVLDVSYKRLDHELKPCFVYLGLFPPRQHIQVDKLYLLLLAENLISSPPPEEESEKSPDQYLREYLDKLAGLKLVEVAEEDILVSSTGLHKSCRLHDQVQQFCISKGLGEEFLEVVDFKNDSKQDIGTHTRRLAIYMRNYRGGGTSISFKGDASVKKILSLLLFDAFESAKGKSEWPSGIGDLTKFTHLRVLNFEEVNFQLRQLPKGLNKLLLLTFLSFRGCFLEDLPSYLSSLTQLETLDLLVRDDCCMIIPDDNIFIDMKRMVHLYLPRQYQRKAEKTKLTLRGLEMLETLINFDTEIFDVEDLSHLKELKILSTITKGRGYPKDLDAVINLLNEPREKLRHSSMEIRSFDCYDGGSIPALKKLLQCRYVHSLQIEGQIGKLPEEQDISKCDERLVAEMVLHGSELEDDPMDYFGRFQNLRSLVLADDAFMGTEITISSSPMFPKLRSLKLRNLQYLEKLTIEEEALPEFSSLKIESCGDALDLTIPKELYLKLKNEIGGDAYSVVPPARLSFKTTT